MGNYIQPVIATDYRNKQLANYLYMVENFNMAAVKSSHP